MEEMKTGAVRSSEYTVTVDSKFPPRFDLLPFEGLRRWAEAFGEGSLKYGDDNFRKGFTDHCLAQHALAHLFLYQAGDKTEDHLGHAMWNIGMLCKMEKERPELLVMQQAIAKEYGKRERPIYATDDIRLQPKTMGQSQVVNTIRKNYFTPDFDVPIGDTGPYCKHCGSVVKFHDEDGACQPQDQPDKAAVSPNLRRDAATAGLFAAVERFMSYGQQHEEKGNREKAESNFQMAYKLERVLNGEKFE